MSGSTLGGFVGAGIGFLVGGPAGARWGWMIGSAVGGYVDPAQIEGPRLQDVRAQTSRDGVPIPFGWGTFPMMGNIIAQGPVVEHENEQDQGKGGPEVTNYTYTRTYAVGLCEGPITGVLQVKRNGKVVYDARTDEDLAADIARELSGVELTGFMGSTFIQIAAAIRAANARFDNKVTFYLGDETQMPDPALEAIFGAGNVPAHRGLAYFVVEDDDVTDTAGAIPQFEVVVAGAGTAINFDPYTSNDAHFIGGIRRLATGYTGPLIRVIRQSDAAEMDIGQTSAGSLDWAALESFIGSDTGIVKTVYKQAGSAAGDGEFGPISSRPIIRTLGVTTSTIEIRDGYLLITGLGTSDPNNPPSGMTVYLECGVPQTEGTRYLFSASNSNLPYTYPNHWSAGWQSDNDLAFSLSNGSLESAVLDYDRAVFGSSGFPDGTVLGMVWRTTGLSRLSLLVNGESVSPSSLTVISEEGTYNDVANQIYIGANSSSVYSPCDVNFEGVSIYMSANPLCSGMAIPDAPGYFTDASGEICGVGGNTVIDRSDVELSTIVADVCERRGLIASEYDVSELTDVVPGFVVGRETDAASIIQSLAPAYFFDPAEWDGKLRFIKRGGTAVASINGDDLVERDGDAFERERVQEAELLRRVTVAYNDPLAGYAPTTQKWERRAGTVQALGEASVELPLTLSSDSAATIAKRRGLTAWGEPEKQKFSLPYRLAALTPTDVINYTDDDGEAHTLRLMDLQDDSGVRYVESSTNRAEAYGATASGVLPVAPSLTDASLRGPTLLAVMDLPLWRGGDADTLGLYVAARGPLSGWQGAVIAVSTDSGVSYSNVTQVTQQAAIGTTTTALVADVSSEYPSGQSLTVALPRAPESVSYESLLRYNNRAALQLDSGAWEILQYQTVVAVDDTTFTLSGLVRGRYATTPGAASSGAAFVLLDAAVQFVPVERHLLGSTVKVRATTFGTSSDAAEPVDVAFTAGASQSEWPVHNVSATRDGSDNVTVTWIGRARIGVETAPYHSANFAGYRVSWDDGTTVTTADTTATTYTITAAADPIDVTVTPLNSITGAGPASEAITV